MPTFADRLQQKIREHSPLCVGIDPSAALLKSCGLPDSAEGALEFGKRVLEAADFRIAVLKPQSAFFERFGSSGFRALEELVQLARAREVLVLLDGKRGDIDTTARRLRGRLLLRDDDAARRCDHDALLPRTRRARSVLRSRDRCGRRRVRGRALVESRRPGAADGAPRERRDGGAEPVPRDHRAQSARSGRRASGRSARWSARPARTRTRPSQRCRNSFVLAPGVGAQGATMRDVLARMPAGRGRVLPNVSRAILANGSRREEIRTTIAEPPGSGARAAVAAARALGDAVKDKTIAAALARAVGAPIDERSKRAVSGGSISQCWRYETARGPVVRQDRVGSRLGGCVRMPRPPACRRWRAPKPSACRRSWPVRHQRRRRLPRARVDHARLADQGERSAARRTTGLAASPDAARGSAGSATTRSARRRSRTPGPSNG